MGVGIISGESVYWSKKVGITAKVVYRYRRGEGIMRRYNGQTK